MGSDRGILGLGRRRALALVVLTTTMVRLVKVYPQQRRLIEEAANTVPRAIESVPDRMRDFGRRNSGVMDWRLPVQRTGGIDGSARW